MKAFSTLRFILFGTSILFASCKSPSQEIDDAFKTVDKSLQSTNDLLTQSIDKTYSEINSNRQKNKALAIKADTIYRAGKNAILLLDSLKQVLHLEDTSGQRLDVASRLLMSNNNGVRMLHAMGAVYEATDNTAVDSANVESLKAVHRSFRIIREDDDVFKRYFHMTPTVAAMTMLSKFQNDCTNATNIALTDISKRLR